jgi:type IV secretion system protein VirB4
VVSLHRILKDYKAAGSVNGLLTIWGFVDDYTFLTKGGHVGMAFGLAGVDYECLDAAARRDVVHRFEAAARTLDERCRLYQYVCKRRVRRFDAGRCEQAVAREAIERRTANLNDRRDDLYQIGLYMVLVYEGMQRRGATSRLKGTLEHPRRALREWLSVAGVLELLDADLSKAVQHLHTKCAALEVQLADSVRLTRLPKNDAFQFLRGLVNYARDAPAARLRYDTHVDFFMADSPIECHRTHLTVGHARVKVLTMKEPPAGTYPHLLEQLYTVPGEFNACLEWRRIANDRMRRDIQRRRRHFFHKRVSLVNYVSPDTKPDEMLIDESAGATVRQLGDALTELEVNGHFFGECSLSVVVFDEDAQRLDRGVTEAEKAVATHDGTLVQETYNLLNAWLATVPGNSAHNLRRMALLDTNLADLSFLFTLDTGAAHSRYFDREALAVFETRHRTPYFFNLHVEDVGHTVVLGATGSGKSFLLNFLITQAQRYAPYTVVFDLGHSYRKLATLFRGSYLEVGTRGQGVSINPFALAPTRENLHFLHSFVRVLLEGADGYRLSDAEDRELYEAIENLYVLDAVQRRLFTLSNLVPRSLASRLSKWIEGGRYGDVFDHVEDTLTLQRFQVFEFENASAYPAVLEALLFYVLHRVNARLVESTVDSQLTLCVMDEAWRFIQHDRLRAYVQEALKTWRKRNAAMVLATQSIDDFASADLLRTVIESCPTKLLLANPALDRVRYADLFRLNETELELLADLTPRQQVLMKRPDVSKVLTLNVDPRSYWLYTNTPTDNDRVAAVVRDHGLEAGLDRLAESA